MVIDWSWFLVLRVLLYGTVCMIYPYSLAANQIRGIRIWAYSCFYSQSKVLEPRTKLPTVASEAVVAPQDKQNKADGWWNPTER